MSVKSGETGKMRNYIKFQRQMRERMFCYKEKGSKVPLVIMQIVVFITEIPVHLTTTPMEGFSELSRRDENLRYLDSYTSHVRKYHWAIGTTLALLLGVSIQIASIVWGLYQVGKPTAVIAYTTSTTTNAIDDFNTYDNYGDLYCEYAPAASLNAGLKTLPDKIYQAHVKFFLGTIPNNATVTKVELITYVTKTASANDTKISSTADQMDPETCASYQDNIIQEYVTTSWTTTGSKTTDLGNTAKTNAQTQINSTDLFSVIIYSSSGTGAYGQFNSASNASNKPQLKVTYTLPPQVPTGMAKGAVTTSSIVWNWTDNATEDTSYNVHNAAHAVVTGCSGLAANTQTCTETGLSANTQYTRHPNVTDPQDNVDGDSASAYTAIETPTGIQIDSISSDSVSMSATGSFTNLAAGSSGLYFENPAYSQNSGWTKTNSWTNSPLVPNVEYEFKVTARNGDALATPQAYSAYTTTLPSLPNITSPRSASTWYNTATFTFDQQDAFGPGGSQYYRYVWDQNSGHTFTGAESTWSEDNSFCPGDVCTATDYTLTTTATAAGNNWYLHLRSYNSNDVPNGSGTNYGPYYFDGTNPDAPATINDGIGADTTYTTSTTQLSANWSAVTDAASGLQKYQYAIGTTSGGTQVVGWTDNSTTTSVTRTGLTLNSGTIYYFSARAVDNAGNNGAVATSNGITVNTSLPTITDNQSGDTTPRKSAGTTYDINFAKASTGPQLDYAQYAVYSAAAKGGTLLKDWTNIFTTDTDSYSTDWTVDFTSLQEGTNYVSVKVVALDTLSNELDDAFTIIKDTTSPAISSFVAAPTTTTAVLTWTTNEAASTQLEYGTTTAYGTTTTLDSNLTTSHSVTISGLANNTTFHARALGGDQAGNAGQSSDLSFTTAAGTRTLITNVQVAVASSTAVTVTWTTNEPATSKVRYGLTTDYGLEVNDSTLVTSHSVSLTGLTAGTTYHYEVLSVGTTSTNDADATFSTTATTVIEPETAATSISGLHVIAGEIAATIIWQTNEAASSTVHYGSTTDYGSTVTVAAKTTAHQIMIRGLAAGLTYHYVVESVGTATATSADATFTTSTTAATINRAVAPTVTNLLVSDGQDPTITITGVAKGHHTLRIIVDSRVVERIKLSGSSQNTKGFSVTVDVSKLSAGKHTLVVQSVDQYGRSSLIRQRTTFTIGTLAKPALEVGQQTSYIVKAGDSLWKIAQEFMGHGADYTKIVTANQGAHPTLVDHPETIQPGWTLTLPAS